jgi:cytochrome b561
MAVPQTSGYTRLQIALHWLVFLLVAFQIVAHDGIVAVVDAARDGTTASSGDALFANLHIAAGIAIFVFVLWRVYLLVTKGAPVPPEQEHPALKLLAKATHGLLYLVLLVMVVSGGAAWFGGIGPAFFVHGTARFLLLALILLHVIGALAHELVFKTDVLRRMFRPRA